MISSLFSFVLFFNFDISISSKFYLTFEEIERACAIVSRGSHRGESRALATIVKYEATRKSFYGQTRYYLHSRNKKTGCYGLWQQHPAHGKPPKTLRGQAEWAWNYARRRYGCACKALNFRKRKGYW